jgi:hypothetical protein
LIEVAIIVDHHRCFHLLSLRGTEVPAAAAAITATASWLLLLLLAPLLLLLLLLLPPPMMRMPLSVLRRQLYLLSIQR